MKTTYYTITAREILVSGDGVEQAVGGVRQLVCARRSRDKSPVRDNIIDLAAWKAAREEAGAREWGNVAPEKSPAVYSPAMPRPRRDHRSRVLFGGELLASLSVVGVMILLMIRILGM